jgi:hypothetical protein
MLRELRQWADIGLRAVSRRSGGKVRLSDSHLSRVERGLRPVTPAVVAAYERALGMRIDAHTLGEITMDGEPDDADRRAFQATVATLAAGIPTGGLGGEGEQRLLQEATYTRRPRQVTAADVNHLEQAASTLRTLDLRHGGELTCQMAGQLLRWAVNQRTATMTAPVRHRWHAALATLAMWGAWSAHDACQRPGARAFAVLALDAAARANEPDLRAHALADIAAQHNHHGHPDDALHTLRMADGDERTSPAVQCILHGVRARAHAALGERDRCFREIKLIEDLVAGVQPDAVPGWLGGWHPAHVPAVIGHAHADLARTTGELDQLDQAHQLLTTAAEQLASIRPRAAALCLTHLAHTHYHHGNPDQATTLTEYARHLATDLRSARLSHDLATLQGNPDGDK